MIDYNMIDYDKIDYFMIEYVIIDYCMIEYWYHIGLSSNLSIITIEFIVITVSSVMRSVISVGILQK